MNNIASIVAAVLTATLSFLFGRYSTYKTNRIAALKEVNESFLKPFLSLYKDTIHSVAVRIFDIPDATLSKMMRLLNDNSVYLAPRLQKQISELDMILSTYRFNFYGRNDENPPDETSIYLNHLCTDVYEALYRQFRKNSRKIYCSPWEQLVYPINEWWIKMKR